jgi:hypothetical protein
MNDWSVGGGWGGAHFAFFLVYPWEQSLHPHCHTGGNPENFLERLMPENERNYSIGQLQFKGQQVYV